MKKSIEVFLLGQKYVIKSEEDEDYVQEIAKYVNGKMDEVQKATKTVSTHSIAILAALNIASEYFKLKETQTTLKKEIYEKSGKLLGYIDSQL